MDVRPEWPDEEEFVARGLTDSVWEVAEQCWQKNASKRPTADALCDLLFHLREIIPRSTPAIPSPIQVRPPPSNPNSNHTLESPSSNIPGTSPALFNPTAQSLFSYPPPIYSTSPLDVDLPESKPAASIVAPMTPPFPLQTTETLYMSDEPPTPNSASSLNKIDEEKALGNKLPMAHHQSTESVQSLQAFKSPQQQALESEDWDVTFRTILNTQNPRQIRETLARSNPDILLPLAKISPLSQTIILGLIHRVSVYLVSPR